MKKKAKKNHAEYWVKCNKTGNDYQDIEPLSDFDRRVMEIYGNYGTGLNIVPEIPAITSRSGVFKLELLKNNNTLR